MQFKIFYGEKYLKLSLLARNMQFLSQVSIPDYVVKLSLIQKTRGIFFENSMACLFSELIVNLFCYTITFSDSPF